MSIILNKNKFKMNYSMLKHLVFICTLLIHNLCCAPIDDQTITTTLSPIPVSLSSEKDTILAEDKSVPEEIRETVNEESSGTDISSKDDSASETTSRIVLDEDIAFFMPKTTISTIISSDDSVTTTSNDDNIVDITTTSNSEEDQQSIVTTTFTPIPELDLSDVTTVNTPKVDLKPVIVNELSSVELFTSGKPFVLICEAENPTSSEVFFTQPIKYSWNKNGRPFDELNDPVNQIYSESSNNGNLLFVSPQSPADEGTYQCIAENQFGKSYSRGAVVMERRRHGSPRALLDPGFSPIEGKPIIEIVPENVPDFGLTREPKLVFYVYPSIPQETEDVEVINMVSAEISDDIQSIVNTPVKPIVDEEKEDLVNDINALLEPLLDGSGDLSASEEEINSTESSEIVAEKEKILNDVKNLVQGLLDNSNLDSAIEEESKALSGLEAIVEDLEEGSGEDGIEGLLNTDPSGGIDLRSA